ncbi:hypothetical protein RB597_000635 [Gaeumannomyces tritici]
MAAGPISFYCLWQEERIRETLFELLANEDICSVRLANSACCNLVTKRLFLRTNLNFGANTFTKASRIQALTRIGHHIQHLTFSFAHSESTFLPPLVHPETGQEISFLYTPYTHMVSSLTRPKYANSELGDILTQQYPPLFHAATNVPSFINALRHLPNMRHLTIRCPGQDARERYRRDIVDYALISLRISLERAPLFKLNKLTLASVHPAAFNYLRHVPGFGCTPSAGRRWRQIRKLYIQVDAWDFYGPSPGLDHLKIIDDYIRHLAPTLEKLSFTWIGRKGPCPIALHADPLFAPARTTKKLFNEVTSPMSPLPPAPTRAPMVLPRLKRLMMRNATMSAPQVSSFIRMHQATVREFDFENVMLLHGGSWDDALSPLTDQSSDRGSDLWSRHSIGSPVAEKPALAKAQSFRGAPPSPAPSGEIALPSPSAAAAAASRELLDLDVEGLESFLGLYGDFGGLPTPRSSPGPPQFMLPAPTTIAEEDEEYQEVQVGAEESDDGLGSDIAAAKEASLSISTKLQKKQVRRRRKHATTREDDETEVEDQRRHHRHHRHKDDDKARERTGDKHDKHRERDSSRTRDANGHSSRRRHRSRSSHNKRGHHVRHRHEKREAEDKRKRPETPPPAMPEVVLAEGDDVFAPSPRGSPAAASSSSPRRLGSLGSPRFNISAPILSRDPMPPLLLLRPTIYDPAQHGQGQQVRSPVDTTPTRPQGQRRGSDGSLDNSVNDDGLSPVQRNLEQEEAHRLLAEDAVARTSALQKAKAAVMQRLARKLGSGPGPAAGPYPGGAGIAVGGPLFGAVPPDLARPGPNSHNGPMGSAGGHSLAGAPSGIMGFRLREGLFGAKSTVSVAQSHQSIDSNTALVPLIFSR